MTSTTSWSNQLYNISCFPTKRPRTIYKASILSISTFILLLNFTTLIYSLANLSTIFLILLIILIFLCLGYPTLVLLICLLLLIIGYVLTLVSWPFYELFTLFSNWTLHITTLSILYCYSAAQTYNLSQKPWLMTKIHWFYSLAIISNFVVVSIYWPVIHPKTIPKHFANGFLPLIIC